VGDGAATSARIAGRVEELGLLRSLVDGASEGRPGAVFVHGEAGVGKTRLVRAACDEAQQAGMTVLWGPCMRFGAVEAAFLPWAVAFEGWLAQTTPDDRSRVISQVPSAGQLLPSLEGSHGEDPVRLLPVVAALLSHIVALRPTVLVLDDIQWADPASRDALTYVLAGFGRERLAVIGTYRDEGMAAGDPTHGWLADLRRLPSVRMLPLSRFSRQETEEQLERLLGGAPSPALVASVLGRTKGNAYLTELLSESLDGDDEDVPPELPDALTDALLAAWHRLSGPARQVARVLAVAGRPAGIAALQSVCTGDGMSGDAVTGTLTEGTSAGILVRSRDHTVWFRHPLLAEVLYATLLPGEAAALHRLWAEEVAATTTTGADEVRRLGSLALHREAAGDLDESFAASVAAADAARGARLWQEEAVHLRRATRLWPLVDTSPAGGRDEIELLERSATVSSRVGHTVDALADGERALALAEGSGDLLRASRLTLWCADEAFWLGRILEEPVDEVQQAVEMTRDSPDSSEHAQALAKLSESLTWRGDLEEARRVAEEALAAARRSGEARALAEAYGARAFASLESDDADSDTQTALRYARETQDPEVFNSIAQWRVNFLVEKGRPLEAVQLEAEVLAAAWQDGVLSDALWCSGVHARSLAELGRLEEAWAVVREGLSVTGAFDKKVAVRLAAGLVSVRRGDLHAAGLHLQRAAELLPNLDERPGLEAPPLLAEHLVAAGAPDRAASLLLRTMPSQAIDLRIADQMLTWGAHAAADLAERARDRRDDDAVSAAYDGLDALTEARSEMAQPPFSRRHAADAESPAWAALYDAERARMTGHSDPDAWRTAAEKCRDANLVWDEQVASWRCARALLVDRSDRATAARLLRDVHQYSVREGADRLRRDVEELARSARLPLDELRPVRPLPGQRKVEPDRLDGLTVREREVLSHLVAGRTYAEIAAALFISEKTVSVHVSNLLRKTGTSSRQEVSELAIRLGERAKAAD
jgi:DNA-binding CsgD family transcriptional regulator/tetratricopeptide (TPR) repeat protein